MRPIHIGGEGSGGGWVYLGLVTLALFTQCGLYNIGNGLSDVASAVRNQHSAPVECRCR